MPFTPFVPLTISPVVTLWLVLLAGSVALARRVWARAGLTQFSAALVDAGTGQGTAVAAAPERRASSAAGRAPAVDAGSRRLRILLVTARYFAYVGGTETHTYEVARRLAAAGHEVTVLTTDPGRQQAPVEWSEGVQIIRVPAWPTGRDYYFAPHIYRIIAQGHWDIVHCQGYHTLVAPLTMLAARRAKIPYIVTFHSGGHSSRLRNALRRVQWHVLRPLLLHAEYLVAVSDFEAAFFRERLRLPAERIVVVPNGSHLPRTLAPREGPGQHLPLTPIRNRPAGSASHGNLIVSVGRLERYKGHQRIIAALPLVAAQCPDVRLRIVGSGPYEPALWRQALRLGVADRLEIGSVAADHRHELVALLSHASVAVLLSEYESQGIAALEALAVGCPVLVADATALHELAERRLARAVPLQSSAAELAAALLEQLRHPLVPASLELPTWESCAAELLHLYRRSVAAHHDEQARSLWRQVGGVAGPRPWRALLGAARMRAAELAIHARVPLYRNAYALIANTVLTSALGILYWMLAARFYTADEVGVNSAAISTMVFLSGLAQLSLVSALVRFVPCAGRATGRLVTWVYLAGLAASALAATLFVLGYQFWASEQRFLGAGLLFTIWFVVATMLWSIFALQDSVLTGLRQAIWVPIENTTFGVVKVALVVLFAATAREHGIFASWTIPMAISVVPINWLVYRRLIPAHVRATKELAVPVSPSQIIHFVGADYLGSLFLLMSTTLLPVLIVDRAGPSANAHFYVAWLIADSLLLVARNMAASLTVEGAADQDNVAWYGRQVLLHIGRLVVPMVLVVVIGAPYVLRLFGASYAAEGATLLRLLSVSAIPYSINTVYLGLARVQRRMSELILLQATLCLSVLGVSYALLPGYGIKGVGLAWLAAQTAVAVLLLATKLRPVLLPSLRHDARSLA